MMLLGRQLAWRFAAIMAVAVAEIAAQAAEIRVGVDFDGVPLSKEEREGLSVNENLS